MEITVRPADPADAAALRALLLELIAEPDLQIPLQPGEFQMTIAEEAAYIRGLNESPNSAIFLAFSGSLLVGELNLNGGQRRATAHEAWLGISVRKGWRGKGIGSRLMARAIIWTEENPLVTRLELGVYATNATAIHLYEEYGFEIEGRRQRKFFQRGVYVDDFIMARLF